MAYKPLVLLIRDGWGIGSGGEGDAVSAANTPNMDALLAKHPTCRLGCSGEAVGLRPGSQGSSEVGHLNMGAGRIVEQEVVRVDRLIKTGELFQQPRLVKAVEQVKANGGRFHLMGLVQDQGVHAMQEHLWTMLKFLASQGVKDVVVHFFADGRDTPPKSALDFLAQLQERFDEYGVGRVGSVMGRYWAMDRGENWDRTEKAYRALMFGEGLTATSAKAAIEHAYQRAEGQKAAGDDIVETDEFIRPTLIVGDDGEPTDLVRSGDALLHFNYRQDRAIQLTKAFVEDGFAGFDRGGVPDVFYMGLTRYYDEFPFSLLPPMNMARLLGEVLCENHLRQLRIAEFQKFRHVTSFFNGKSLEPYGGEDDVQVDSISIPEDQKPEMSAYEVTDLVLTAVSDGIKALRDRAAGADNTKLELRELPGDGGDLAGTYDVIVINYANGDMVGHTGVFDAAVKAIEAVDECLGKVVEAVLARDGALLVTSDHGNAEQMLDPETGGTQTAHTVNDVHCVLVSNDSQRYQLVERGKLGDVAPTMLGLLGIEKPAEMTAESLIKSAK
jgi:2,3-bisphosphoglycerate-independent phosphoglycerate mutase